MRRFFTLFFSFIALAATAQEVDQTFQFVDAQGNAVADGTVITIYGIDADGKMMVPLSVKNMAGEKAAVSMYETIDGKPSGTWQTCAFGNCMMLNETGYSSKSVVAADYDGEIETEWIPEEGKYASWTATLQIQIFNIVTKTAFGRTTETVGTDVIGYGPKVTVNFVYNAESAHIGSAQTDVTPVEYYNLRGQRISSPQKGLCVVRLSNGKTLKQLFY